MTQQPPPSSRERRVTAGSRATSPEGDRDPADACTRTQLVALVGTIVVAGVVGTWAYALPREFYDHFPVVLGEWISLDGPYNEHLVRDHGAQYLALGAASVAAPGVAVPGGQPRPRDRLDAVRGAPPRLPRHAPGPDDDGRRDGTGDRAGDRGRPGVRHRGPRAAPTQPARPVRVTASHRVRHAVGHASGGAACTLSRRRARRSRSARDWWSRACRTTARRAPSRSAPRGAGAPRSRRC